MYTLFELLPKTIEELSKFSYSISFLNGNYPGITYNFTDLTLISKPFYILGRFLASDSNNATYYDSRTDNTGANWSFEQVLLNPPRILTGGKANIKINGKKVYEVENLGDNPVFIGNLYSSKEPKTICKCDIHLLMRSGCGCGAFEKEKGV